MSVTSRRKLTWCEERHYDFYALEVGMQVYDKLQNLLIHGGFVVLVKLYL